MCRNGDSKSWFENEALHDSSWRSDYMFTLFLEQIYKNTSLKFCENLE